MPKRPHIGWTFSPQQAEWLGLEPLPSFQEFVDSHPNIIRLGLRWDLIEPSPGNYSFDSITPYLTYAQKHSQKILLSLGMKSPRWPEFYFPSHVLADPANAATQERALKYIENSIAALKSYSCITHWQVENEPLDPSGPNNQVIPFAFLKQEIELVRSLDSRPIVVNVWGNDVVARGLWPRATTLADIIGLDLYYSQHLTTVLGRPLYRGPSQPDSLLKKMIRQSEPSVWITELQAEPWEENGENFRSPDAQSMNLDTLRKNLEHAKALNVEAILLWGAEYWIWKNELATVRSILAETFGTK